MRIILTICGLVAALAALPTYMWATGTRLHAQPDSVPSLTAPEPPAQWASAVTRARHAMRAGVAAQNLPGASVAVGVAGDIVWAEGFGWADLETLRPVAPDTRFRIGTASKLLTSAGVDVLMKEGRLTQGQLASLSTTREDEQWSRQRCEHPLDPVSAAVESAAGQPFLTFMREQVFQPLRMKQTDAESAAKENPEDVGGPGEDPPPFTAIHDLILRPLGIDGNSVPATVGKSLNLATIYAPGWGQHPALRYHLHVMQPRNLSCYAGSMAFFSTPSDLVRFAMATNATATELDGNLHGARVVSLVTLPDGGIVVAVMTNGSYANTSALAQQVADGFE